MRKTQSFEKLKVESEKCLAQSERICEEKVEFETALYAKVLKVSYTCDLNFTPSVFFFVISVSAIPF